MILYSLAWLAVLLPLAGAAGSFLAESPRRSAQICIGFTTAAAALALAILVYRLDHNGDPYQSVITFWCRTCTAGSTIDDFHLQVGVIVDAFSAVMLLLTTCTGLAVLVHSSGYLRGEFGYRTLQWQTSVLVFAAAGAAMSSNIFTLLLMWGVGGVAVYLVTAHWTDRAGVGHAARRVFAAMRAGEVALVLAIAIVYAKFGADVTTQVPANGDNITDPLSFTVLGHEAQKAATGAIDHTGTHTLIVLGVLLLIAVVLRAALVPLHSWLLGVDEAPTPVAGYVAAAGVAIPGVVLLARMYPLVSLAPHLLVVVAVLGALTAVVPGVLALAHRDLVRIVMYGGISQLGMAVLAFAAGAWSAGVFWMVTRGLLLLALFLGCANLMGAYRSRDIGEVAAAGRAMPLTSRMMLLTAVTSAGVVPLSGFWALRGVLSGIVNDRAYNGAHLGHAAQALALAAAIAGALLAAMWPLRLWLLTSRGAPPRRRGFTYERLRDADWRQRRPLAALAVVAALVGFLDIPGVRPSFARYVIIPGPGTAQQASVAAAVLAVVVPLAGVALAWFAWGTVPRAIPAALERIAAADAGAAAVDDLVVGRLGETAAFALTRFDEAVVDPLVDAATGLAAAPRAEARPRVHHTVALVGGVVASGVVAGAVALGFAGHLPGVHP